MAQLNFQTLEAYNVDAENFNHNVSDMVDSIFVGPQGELLQNIQVFNDNYGANIGVTKSFTMKPGGYDEIKKAHANWVLRYDMKPRGIQSIFDRIDQYRWRDSNFRNSLLRIDSQMKSLKRSGMRWQDNTDQFEDELQKLLASVSTSIKQARDLYPNIKISSKVIPIGESRGTHLRGRWTSEKNSFPSNILFTEHPKDFLICIYMEIPTVPMTVHVLDESTRIDQYNLKMGTIKVLSGTFLLPMISRNWGRDTPATGSVPQSTYTYFLDALYLDNFQKSFHPYITESRDRHQYNLGASMGSGNICTGNMGVDLRQSLINNEILAHIVNLYTWLTNYYVPQTYPLNKINKARTFGENMYFTQWRNDLNSSSESVFTHEYVNDGTVSMPTDCGLSNNIYNNAQDYAQNKCGRNRWAAFNDELSFASNEEIYIERMEEYLERLSVDDMPCGECFFKSDCGQKVGIDLILDNNHLEPEEEAILGEMWELYTWYDRTIGSNYNTIHWYVEEVIRDAYLFNEYQEDYFTMKITIDMVTYWFIQEGLDVHEGTRYRDRCRAIYNMNKKDRLSLFKIHHLENTDFEWCLDNIRSYRAPVSKDDKPVEEIKTPFDPLDVMSAAEIINEPPIQGDREQEPHEAGIVTDNNDMTPEQRAIQWAIDNGGAQNL